MPVEPAILWIDDNISMQVPAEGDEILHCGEGIVEQPPSDDNFVIRQHCAPVARDSVDCKRDRLDLFALIGVESWEDIVNLEAAATFTRIVVSFETGLDGTKASIEDVLEDYKRAVEARESIGAGLLDSPRWDNVQRRLFSYLKKRCAENPANVETLVIFNELLKRADGPEDVAYNLLELRWHYANVYDRVELCQDRECRDYYEREVGKEIDRKYRRHPLIPNIVFPMPARKRHILGATLGVAAGLRDEDRFVPGVDVSVTAQIPNAVRVTAGTNIVYDDYYAKGTNYGNGTTQSLIDMGLVISPYLKVGLIPFGEGASLDIGGRLEIFEAERKVFIDTPYTSPQLTARQHMVKTSILPEIGYTVYLLENLSASTGLTIPMDEDDPVTLTFTVGILHWFTKK